MSEQAITGGADRVLATLARHDGPLSIAALAEQTDLAQSTLYRQIALLKRWGFVSEQNGLYGPGPLCVQLAWGFDQPSFLVQESQPDMGALAMASGETVGLLVAMKDQTVCLDMIESTHRLRCSFVKGRGLPLLRGASWGSFQALRRWLDGEGDTEPALVFNLDAHFDLRTGRPGSSGTPFDQIATYCAEHGHVWQYACYGVSKLANTPALFVRAAEINAIWVEDYAMQERHLNQQLAELDALLARVGHVYLTIDIDVLPASIAPGVSAPAPYGVPLSVIEAIVLRIKHSGKLRVADLAECNPQYDVDNHTARVAARLACQLLAP